MTCSWAWICGENIGEGQKIFCLSEDFFVCGDYNVDKVWECVMIQ